MAKKFAPWYAWTPAHLAIYLGGVLAGLSCGWLAIRTTFRGTERSAKPPEPDRGRVFDTEVGARVLASAEAR
jgi:hypothetical protein